MVLYDNYKPFRNRLSALDRWDTLEVLWAYAQYWQVAQFQMPAAIEVNPPFLQSRHEQPYIWQIERLARESILHAGLSADRGRTLRSWKILAQTINAMRALEEAIHEAIVPAERALHALVRISHEQFPWAGGPNIRLAARYFRIYDRERIKALFLEETGLSLEKVFLIGMGLWGHFTGRASIAADIEVQVPNLTAADMQGVLRLVGKDFHELRGLIGAAHQIDETYEYQFNHLRAFPLVKLARGGIDRYLCPVPTLLFWRFTSGLYYDLVGKSQDFGTELGASFADYAGEALRRATDGSNLQVIAEAPYQAGHGEERTADWLVEQNGTHAAFIECKTKRLRHDAKAHIVDLEVFEADVGALADSVVQLYRTIVDYEAGRYPNLAFAAERQVYPVVVTMEEWYPFGVVRRRLREFVNARLTAGGLAGDLVQRMPYCVMSAAELEKAAQLWAAVGLGEAFETFLRDAQYEGWVISSYIAHRFPQQAFRTLFDDEFDARLTALVQAGPAIPAAPVG
jgi:hypothetical protein